MVLKYDDHLTGSLVTVLNESQPGPSVPLSSTQPGHRGAHLHRAQVQQVPLAVVDDCHLLLPADQDQTDDISEVVLGSPFLLTDQQQVGEEQEDEGLFAHFLAKSQLISVVFPADPSALGLLDQVSGGGH